MSEQQRASHYRASGLGRIRDNRTRSGAFLLSLAAAAALGLSGTANAADWVGPPGTAAPFEDGANWSGQTVPGPSDDALINNGGIANLTTGESVMSLQLGSVADGSGSLTQNGGSLSTQVGSAAGVLIGGSDASGTGTGSYTLNSGSINTNSGFFVVGMSGGTGTFVMNDGTIDAFHLFHGWGANGQATGTQTGGTINTVLHFLTSEGAGTSTSYTMTGGAINVGASMFVGSHGAGTLDLSGTGAISVAGNFQVGANGTAGTNGMLNMSGGSLTVLNGNHIILGNLGTGAADVSGGTINTPRLNLGQGASGVGTVTQTGGTVNVDTALVIGEASQNDNVYNITDGTLNLRNASTNNVSLRAGSSTGKGTLNVGGSGVVNIDAHIIAGGGATAVGAINVSGGTVELGKNVEGGGVLVLGDFGVATLDISGGEVTSHFFQSGRVNNGISRGQATQTGGTYTVANNMHIGQVADTDSFYEITGGTLDVGGNLTVARQSTDPDAGSVVYSNGRLTVGGTGNVTVAGQLGNSPGFEFQPAGDPPPDPILLPGGTGLIEVTGGTLTAGSFLNGSLNPDSGGGASANYVQSGGVASLGEVTGTGSISVSGGSMTVSSMSQSSVNISGTGVVQVAAGGTDASVLGSLSISGSGTLDLTNNAMAISNTPLSEVHEYVKRGYNGGDWQGDGITSSSAAAESGRALGIGPDGDDVLVKFTWSGDANLDGAVTIADLGILAANWQQSDRFWFHGDFNYDNQVTIADLGILAANWQQGTSGGGVSFEEAMAMFDVFAGVVVPEPSALGLIGLAGLGTLQRRRRLA